jgi:enterochelin esterase-like enzyme
LATSTNFIASLQSAHCGITCLESGKFDTRSSREAVCAPGVVEVTPFRGNSMTVFYPAHQLPDKGPGGRPLRYVGRDKGYISGVQIMNSSTNLTELKGGRSRGCLIFVWIQLALATHTDPNDRRNDPVQRKTFTRIPFKNRLVERGRMKFLKLFYACAAATVFTSGSSASAQVQTNVPAPVPGTHPITVEHIKIHGTALEGNLEGDAVDRDVIVFLPPSYQREPKRHYPVVYALHGYSIGAEQWTHEIHVPQTIERAFALGSKEMIVVLPDSKTIYNGSMYSSSETTGDFERFIYHDVVAYIDAHYRTIAERSSRGLVGHSMGGYGTSRIGMKHPEVFAVLYIMSPCCLSPRAGAGPEISDQVKERSLAAERKVNEAKSPVDLAAQSPGFGAASYAAAAAWAPDPKNPPLYFYLPTKDGVPQPEIVAKFAANAPLAFLDQYIGNLKQYRAISIDVGDQDGLHFDAVKLHKILDNYGIANTFEVYSGTHTSAVADRFQNHVLPFLSKNLCFTKSCQ